jgi:hypothetical protein
MGPVRCAGLDAGAMRHDADRGRGPLRGELSRDTETLPAVRRPAREGVRLLRLAGARPCLIVRLSFIGERRALDALHDQLTDGQATIPIDWIQAPIHHLDRDLPSEPRMDRRRGEVDDETTASGRGARWAVSAKPPASDWSYALPASTSLATVPPDGTLLAVGNFEATSRSCAPRTALCSGRSTTANSAGSRGSRPRAPGSTSSRAPATRARLACSTRRRERPRLGRAVRSLCGRHGRPWVACTGHGRASLLRAVERAVSLLPEARG